MRCLSSAVFVAIAWLEFLPRTDGFFSCSHLRSPLFQHGNSRCLSISSALRVRREISGEESIQEEVMILRGSEIKKILKTLNAEIKGLFEKEELAKVLVKYEVNSRGTRLGRICRRVSMSNFVSWFSNLTATSRSGRLPCMIKQISFRTPIMLGLMSR